MKPKLLRKIYKGMVIKFRVENKQTRKWKRLVKRLAIYKFVRFV